MALRQNVIFIGDGGVGKTAIKNRLLGLGFNQSYIPTYGIRPADAGMIDSSGQEKIGADWSAISRTVDRVAIVFDLTSKLSFKNLQTWVDLARREFPSRPIQILGNKSDCSRRVKNREIEIFCDRHLCGYTEVSAKQNLNIGQIR